MKKYRAGIVGATGTVGTKLASLLCGHPWFELTAVAASSRSLGKFVEGLPVLDAKKSIEELSQKCDVVFCAVNGNKNEVQSLEFSLAKKELPVISATSACRDVPDVPVVFPELNAKHLSVLSYQRKRLSLKRGFVVTKANCSLQSYLPLLYPLRIFGLKSVSVCTYQAVSGAGKTFDTMPEIKDNVIPYIEAEEEKSEREPLKILGTVKNGRIVNASKPVFSAQCARVPVSDGHLAAVSFSLYRKTKREDILNAWTRFRPDTETLHLPSAPKRFITYLTENDRPQPASDRYIEHGMGIAAGRLREDSLFDYKCFGLSHNLIRGAAGGAILLAELLAAKGFLDGGKL